VVPGLRHSQQNSLDSQENADEPKRYRGRHLLSLGDYSYQTTDQRIHDETYDQHAIRHPKHVGVGVVFVRTVCVENGFDCAFDRRIG
jgi:hypothetical protein